MRQNEMSNIIVGIDLGTTNSEVAVVDAGKVTVIKQGSTPMIPSVVGMSADDQLLVGETAKNQYALYPERTIKSIKRLMGSRGHVRLDGQAYTPSEISALILKYLKTLAENYLGQEVTRAVITVPAYFSDAQRQATREAGEIAGLCVERVVNEPTAAALAYELDHSNESKQVLVYDLGGGTFDVSVVAIEDGVVEVLASHGNNHLGGDDFDQKIVDRLAAHLETQGIDVRQHKQAYSRLLRAAEVAKITLSKHAFARIEEEYLLEHHEQPVHLIYEMSLSEYEQLINPLIDETLEAIHTALLGADLAASDIDEVILVGGSTRTPLIRKRLSDIFPVHVRDEIDPDLCVASGAATHAANLSLEQTGAVLVDITPYTFGTSALTRRDDGSLYPYHFCPIVKKNSVLPIVKKEIFYTAQDAQESVEVNIYQGEHVDALNNILIGQFVVEGLSNVPQGNEIELCLKLDLDGILEVTALEKSTGLQKTVTIDSAMSQLSESTLDQAKARISELFNKCIEANSVFHTPKAQLLSTATNVSQQTEVMQKSDSGGASDEHDSKIQRLVEKAEILLSSALDDDKEDLTDHITSVKQALESGDSYTLNEAVEQLSDLVYYLET